ncbi:M24 family metallopeptidase [Natronosalvus amylolyticus]|uniref:M24 family metallopeptidase n=1 Tax=Natronosalvus amylolyticus TaxID=2961994 RepID=UPI0020C9838D|nr:M24 family metallopeptidase [Natronosalvus amylolyticus]
MSERSVGASGNGSVFDTVRATRLRDVLEERGATAFVHAGTLGDPTIRFAVRACRASCPEGERFESPTRVQHGTVYAVGFDGERWHSVSKPPRDGGDHPSQTLGESLLEAEIDGAGRNLRLLTPAHIPHDAALYLERAGFELASSDVLSRLRVRKTEPELAAIERVQEAVRAGLERAMSLLEKESPTPGRLETALEVGVLEAGGRPVSSAVVWTGANGGVTDGDPTAPLPTDRPLILTVEASNAGYYGRQTRTLVVDPDGGPERRGHIGLTHGFRSVQSLLTAGEATVGTVEADLEAEIRAFGFDETASIEVQVSGVGLEGLERPLQAGTTIERRSPVVVDASLVTSVGRIRLADVIVRTGERARWLSPASRSLVPKNR